MKKLREDQVRLLQLIARSKSGGFWPNADDRRAYQALNRKGWTFWNHNMQLVLTPAGRQAIADHKIEV